jgi:putative transport protein
MIEILSINPVLLLFITAALGYAIGRIRIKGASLGVAAVLFVGLFIGSFSPELRVPDFAFTFGLAVFVYTIGLTSGAGFFASFTRKGLRDNLFIVAMLVIATAIVWAGAIALNLKSTIATGVFAGSLTTTPALAAVIETVRQHASPEMVDALISEPVVGYSATYPMGVLGPIFAIMAMSALLRINYRKEAEKLSSFRLVDQEIYNVTVEVTQPEYVGTPMRELMRSNSWNVVFGRMAHDDQVSLADGNTILQLGDLVSVIGAPDDVDNVVSALGTPSQLHLDLDRSKYDFRRIFVSRTEIAGRTIAELSLPHEYDAIITRVRRGDIDFVATGATVLELGDRVRVVASREHMKDVSDFFGDSYKELSEIDLLSFGLGMSLGLLLGLIPIPLPGGIRITLGAAGGPLIVALILGAIRRTGPIVWTIPYSANLTLRQLGLIMLLATIGLKSGYTFVSTFAGGGGWSIMLAGAVVSISVPLIALYVGYKFLQIPFGMLTGMVAALHTQPAVLGFASEQSEDEAPNLGWALAYPISLIGKIVLAQVLLALLSRSGG